MWCYYLGREMNCHGFCDGCGAHHTQYFHDNTPLNYECPDCHGKFNMATPKEGAYHCPFCGKLMKGLS